VGCPETDDSGGALILPQFRPDFTESRLQRIEKPIRIAPSQHKYSAFDGIVSIFAPISGTQRALRTCFWVKSILRTDFGKFLPNFSFQNT
jgi:hypothetical protein